MWSYFNYREVPYKLRRGPGHLIPATRSVHFCGSLIWNKLANLVKYSWSISEFKNIIKKIENIDYACMICRRKCTGNQFPR